MKESSSSLSIIGESYHGPFDHVFTRSDIGACRQNKEPIVFSMYMLGRTLTRDLKLDNEGRYLMNPFYGFGLDEIPDKSLSHYLVATVGQYFVLIDDNGFAFASEKPFRGQIEHDFTSIKFPKKEKSFFEGIVNTNHGTILLTVNYSVQWPYYEPKLRLFIEDAVADRIPTGLSIDESNVKLAQLDAREKLFKDLKINHPERWGTKDKMISVKVYRSAEEIGGNCILLKTRRSSIILDIGSPLDGSKVCNLDEDLVHADACLLSHAHIDHYGEVEKLSPKTSIYSGKTTKALIDATRLFTSKPLLINEWVIFEDGVKFSIGDFKITPFLVDHSAFDSYAFLIECGTKKIIYTGDFRNHGRLSNDITSLEESLPKNVDLLLCEGTMMSRNNEKISKEENLESSLFNLLKDVDKPAFIQMSSQNIDRIVSVYKAAQRLGRIFIIDPYTAYILDLIDNQSVPKASWKGIRVFYPNRLSKRIADYIDKSILYRYKKFRIDKDELNIILPNTIMLVRDTMIYDFEKRLKNIDSAIFIHSMWEGYWDKSQSELKALVAKKNMQVVQLHIGGHAFNADICTLINSVNPKNVIPVHTENPEGFPGNTIIMKNGDEISI